MHIDLGSTLENVPAREVGAAEWILLETDSLQESDLNLHESEKSFTGVFQPCF